MPKNPEEEIKVPATDDITIDEQYIYRLDDEEEHDFFPDKSISSKLKFNGEPPLMLKGDYMIPDVCELLVQAMKAKDTSVQSYRLPQIVIICSNSAAVI